MLVATSPLMSDFSRPFHWTCDRVLRLLGPPCSTARGRERMSERVWDPAGCCSGHWQEQAPFTQRAALNPLWKEHARERARPAALDTGRSSLVRVLLWYTGGGACAPEAQRVCYSAVLALPSADSHVLSAQLALCLITWSSCPPPARAKGQCNSLFWVPALSGS